MTLRLAKPLALAALLLSPAFAAAQTRTSGARVSSGTDTPAFGAALGAYDYSLLLGLDLPPSGLSVGPRLTGEVMFGYADVAPQARLDLGLRGSFAYHSGDFNGSLWILEAVPDAKLQLALSPQLALYGDVGLGLALQHSSVDVPLFLGGGSASDDTLALAIEFGGGVSYALSPNLNLLGEVRFNFYTSGSSTFVTLPTIGLQWR
jgi:opacity protein-like surface antigen